MTYDIKEQMVLEKIGEAKRILREEYLSEGQVKALTLTIELAQDSKRNISRRYGWITSAINVVSNKH